MQLKGSRLLSRKTFSGEGQKRDPKQIRDVKGEQGLAPRSNKPTTKTSWVFRLDDKRRTVLHRGGGFKARQEQILDALFCGTSSTS